MRRWLSSHPQLTPIVISILRTELGPWRGPTAVPPGEQCLLCSPQDLLGYNCSTNVIVNFNRLWLCSQFLQHNDSNSSWEYWNWAAVWVSVSPQGFYCRCRARHPCCAFVLLMAWGAHLAKTFTPCLSTRAKGLNLTKLFMQVEQWPDRFTAAWITIWPLRMYKY